VTFSFSETRDQIPQKHIKGIMTV